jgi:hypothetical protein
MSLDCSLSRGVIVGLTVNGEARPVLLAPAVFDELAREAQLARDVSMIRKAMREIDDGEGEEAGAFFGKLRSRLLAMKRGKPAGAAK